MLVDWENHYGIHEDFSLPHSSGQVEALLLSSHYRFISNIQKLSNLWMLKVRFPIFKANNSDIGASLALPAAMHRTDHSRIF